MPREIGSFVRILFFGVVLAILLVGCSQPGTDASRRGGDEVGARETDRPTAAEATRPAKCKDFNEVPAYKQPRECTSEDAMREAVEGTNASAVSPSASASASSSSSAEATGLEKTPAFYRMQCRMDTYAVDQNMDKQEANEFADELADRLIGDMEAGGSKDVDDIMDDMGVPSYESQCG